MQIPEQRPPLTDALTGVEFERWYWLKDELLTFARSRGIRTSGGKDELAARIRASLDGVASPASPASTRPARAARQLAEPLTPHTVIPAGQRCSQVLRAWFETEIGPSFTFDAPMRDFVATSHGTATLADAVAHWHATRNAEPTEIGSQFEFNRFTRRWHESHPGGARAELLDAWRAYRALPADQRERA
ncbi:DUF6434 domain-containing protein [Mycetocola zhadangensis]|uniref:DUF6434 domain-containing protein n=1 Tax=Mycetocola zhadangensis TaxID=1164595 RepID=A0A3L7J6V4_9MICO|nr:DUF6434 domain-containing protein [Mycetocola zhadangensis]RLQ84232.1 hypothetical protein D9V28_08450 [Mycetocola zhadangensis]GGE94885.1 hypothetical protein GCM10011313_17330 [Mycetocola zhadangensis]